ncbi:MAG: hypothetical protein WBC09_13475, partial [Thermoanaerobaculia bacterium]
VNPVFRFRFRQRMSTVIWMTVLTAVSAAAFGGVPYLDADGKAFPFDSDEEVLEFLRTAKIVSKEKLGEGTNKSKRKIVLEKDGVRCNAVLRTGYTVVASGDSGFVDSYLSEVAAYELSRLIGFDNVPAVVRRKGGSIQIWIENARTVRSILEQDELPYSDEWVDQQRQIMIAFDNLIANTDRNPGNILIDGNDKVWFIDHTRSFAGQDDLREPEAITGFDRDLWQNLRDLPDKAIEEAVGPYVTGYLPDLLKRRRLLVDEIDRRIAAEGADNFLFTLGSP